jgi:hypothetical protein
MDNSTIDLPKNPQATKLLGHGRQERILVRGERVYPVEKVDQRNNVRRGRQPAAVDIG